MAEIFENATPKWAGSFARAKQGAMFSANGDVALVQQWSVNYQLPIQELYECGSSNVYFAASAPQGVLSIARIVSKKGVAMEASICKPKAYTIKQSGNCDAGNVQITLHSCVLQSVSWSANAQNAYIDEAVTFKFIGAEKR